MQVAVLTQYKSHSLDRHISQTWPIPPLLDSYISAVGAQQRLGPRWFVGSADAILQNHNLIDDAEPDYVLVFGADNIYRMDPRHMVRQHIETGAACTVAGMRVPKAEATAFGCIQTDASDPTKIAAFVEKPANPPTIPGMPDLSYVSMGNYCFTTEALIEVLRADADNPDSRHDMGGDIVPTFTARGEAAVYDFNKHSVPGSTPEDHGYWRDVGTIDAYYEASMDLVAVKPQFNLYNEEWPILTRIPAIPPAKFVHEEAGRTGAAYNSMISPGVIISGGTVRGSVVSPGAHIRSGALVEGSVILDEVVIGRGAVVRNAIIDKGVVIPDGTQIGVDPARDAERFTLSDSGKIVVIGKKDRVG
jgi:glucose-1-phosphate adenylyltransferase